jgi:hypothetical protein
MNCFEMELIKKYKEEYFRACKKEKSEILDECIKLTKLKRNSVVQKIKRTREEDFRKFKNKGKRKGRSKIYIQQHKNLVKKVWILAGMICAENLFPVLRELISILEAKGKLENFSETTIKQCRNISLATLKRIIAGFPRKSRKIFKKGSPIFKKVPVDANFNRFTKQPGNIEIDYVEHNGGNSSGRFVITGVYCCLFSQWTTRSAGWGKNYSSIEHIYRNNMKKFHHKIYRYHPDNCRTTLTLLDNMLAKKHNLKFDVLSRSRPYKKNDNAHVEQKNHDKVRKLVGYWRYDTQEAVNTLNYLYFLEDIISNFFIPTMKLKEKVYDENGRLIKKIYYKPSTPYKRLMNSNQVERVSKDKLKRIKEGLDLIELRNKSNELLHKLTELRG